jgi:hypothetical protein
VETELIPGDMVIIDEIGDQLRMLGFEIKPGRAG